jgi:hypothetical protein
MNELRIYTQQTYMGEWIAYDENYCGAAESFCPVGYGDTEQDAINDYKLKIDEV